MARKQTYLKEWRKFRHLTQEQVVARLEVLEDPQLPRTAASLSRIENGRQVYGQPILEALAEVYGTEPGHLLNRNPFKEGRIIDLMARLNPAQLAQAERVIEALAEPRDDWRGPPTDRKAS